MITRRDLIPGYQSVQPAHALAEFAVQFPTTFRRWHKNHKNLVIVSVPNELALTSLYNQARDAKLKTIIFREPDIGNEHTAVAIEPNEITYKLISSLPLALKEYTEDARKSTAPAETA